MPDAAPEIFTIAGVPVSVGSRGFSGIEISIPATSDDDAKLVLAQLQKRINHKYEAPFEGSTVSVTYRSEDEGIRHVKPPLTLRGVIDECKAMAQEFDTMDTLKQHAEQAAQGFERRFAEKTITPYLNDAAAHLKLTDEQKAGLKEALIIRQIQRSNQRG